MFAKPREARVLPDVNRQCPRENERGSFVILSQQFSSHHVDLRRQFQDVPGSDREVVRG